MQPSARISAAIELLDQLFARWAEGKRAPADALLDQYFRARRYIGSKDRGAIAELVYWTLRHKASLEWWMERRYAQAHKDARLLVLTALSFRGDTAGYGLASLFTGESYAPSPLTQDELAYANRLEGRQFFHPDMPLPARLNFPAWLEPQLTQIFGPDIEPELLALQEQAPVDLRVNTLKAPRGALKEALAKEGIFAEDTPLSPWGLRLAKRAPVFASPLFKAGHFEMQDAGSQRLALLTGAKPGQKVIDFCAGAGGKTLAIAAMMGNKGRILAWDTSPNRLEQIRPRLRRAGVDTVQTHVITSESDPFIKRHKDSADIVLVDAPCSGTGTWRRNPDLKWRFSPEDLRELTELQRRILASAARLVKPGGRLLYATCSLLRAENEAQIEALLHSCNTFRVVSADEMWDKTPVESGGPNGGFLRLTPHKDGADGFFAAVLERLPQGDSAHHETISGAAVKEP